LENIRNFDIKKDFLYILKKSFKFFDQEKVILSNSILIISN
jgi:hypothetical protein